LLVTHNATIKYFQDSQILDFLFASHLGGKSLSPVVSGAVFHNAEESMCDLHLMRFKYTEGYKEIIERDSITGGIFHDNVKNSND